jgi:HEPN domain-containing protein
MASEVDGWWLQTLDDLDTAKANHEIKKYHISSLFSQQAVEKALKAYYIKKFKELKKTHDIVYLANELSLPHDLVDYCKQLNPIYSQSRYPDACGELPSDVFTEEEAQEFIKKAEEVLSWIQKKI